MPGGLTAYGLTVVHRGTMPGEGSGREKSSEQSTEEAGSLRELGSEEVKNDSTQSLNHD